MRFLLVFTAILMFSFADCQRPKPTSDSTPPRVKWKLYNENTGKLEILDVENEKTELYGSKVFPVKPGDRFRVTLVAEDPEGLHEISLSSSGFWVCKSEGYSMSYLTTFKPAGDTIPFEANDAGNVIPQFYLNADVEIFSLPCNPYYTVVEAEISFRGSAKNYFDMPSEETLTLRTQF